jgi:hypothetical protein
MRLPQSKENPYPGLYFSWDDNGAIVLLAIEDSEVFYVRQSGKWNIFPHVEEYFRNPIGFEVDQSHVKQAIDLVDQHHAEGTAITDVEIEKFPKYMY